MYETTSERPHRSFCRSIHPDGLYPSGCHDDGSSGRAGRRHNDNTARNDTVYDSSFDAACHGPVHDGSRDSGSSNDFTASGCR